MKHHSPEYQALLSQLTDQQKVLIPEYIHEELLRHTITEKVAIDFNERVQTYKRIGMVVDPIGLLITALKCTLGAKEHICNAVCDVVFEYAIKTLLHDENEKQYSAKIPKMIAFCWNI